MTLIYCNPNCNLIKLFWNIFQNNARRKCLEAIFVLGLKIASDNQFYGQFLEVRQLFKKWPNFCNMCQVLWTFSWAAINRPWKFLITIINIITPKHGIFLKKHTAAQKFFVFAFFYSENGHIWESVVKPNYF